MTDQTDAQHPDEPEGGAEQAPAPTPVPAQSEKKAQRPSQRPDVSYTPVSNGMDYLVSVFQHLTEGEKPPGARDLKYTVLHLQAATEVLLKARLAQEHFSLIFQNPAEASHETWESGKFKSCGTLDAFDRLRNIARLDLDANDRKRIKELGESRNALQHYGLTHNAYAIESRAARVLEFLITFIHQHLIPGLDPAEARGVERDMDSFRLQLKGIETLVKQRMNNLRSDLAKVADVTVKCPDCEQWAMVAYDSKDEGPSCLFCHQVWPDNPESAAVNYAWIILGQDEHSDFQDGGDPPVVDCPECGVCALVPDAVTAAGQPGATPLCFSCGTVFKHLIDCEGGCGSVLDIAPDDDSIPMCSDCIDIRYARF
ncbi:hypothetical protein ACFYY1_38955 [Streptomyces sp. NPDC001890]|uniref:hypothetical protein n=1 Tax=Streptomyces sp. NPDC001890 TaxID=3364620 RepID=UPI0036C4982C